MRGKVGGVAIPPVVARILSGDSTSPLTREARVVVRGEGMLPFCNGCGNGVGRCNGRGKQGKDALACVPIVSHGCETKKHTQTLTLRKANRIVRM